MKSIFTVNLFAIWLVAIVSIASANVVFREEQPEQETTALPIELQSNGLEESQENSTAGGVVPARIGETSGRTFGFINKKIHAVENKISYLLSKLWSPFAPIYIDVQQDPHESGAVIYEQEKPASIFSPLTNIFKFPQKHHRYNDYSPQISYHDISKRSVENEEESTTAAVTESPATNFVPGQSQGRTLNHILPFFHSAQNRFNEFMHQMFFPRHQQQQPPFPYHKTGINYPQGDLSEYNSGSSSQFHYQSHPQPPLSNQLSNSLFPSLFKRLFKINHENDYTSKSASEYLGGVLQNIQTPVVHQRNNFFPTNN